MEKRLNEIFKDDPRREAQYCALLAWCGKTPKEAAEIITRPYEEVDKQVHADGSISTSIAKLKEKSDELMGRNRYKAIVEIIVAIHDKWVETNAKKCNQTGKEKNKKQLFQHLPTALIGVDEVAKDLMFLAPFLKHLYGINIGTMQNQPWGTFIPSTKFVNAYNKYVADFKDEKKLDSEKDLADYLSKMTKKYALLHGEDEISKKRRKC